MIHSIASEEIDPREILLTWRFAGLHAGSAHRPRAERSTMQASAPSLIWDEFGRLVVRLSALQVPAASMLMGRVFMLGVGDAAFVRLDGDLASSTTYVGIFTDNMSRREIIYTCDLYGSNPLD